MQEAAVVGKERVKPPCSTRALLVALRLMVVFCALFPLAFYPYELALSYFIFGEENAKIEATNVFALLNMDDDEDGDDAEADVKDGDGEEEAKEEP